jgi:Family of unknown function (DUF6152)
MNHKISASIALVIFLAPGVAWAHHNMSALFDFNQRFTRTGTLIKLDWRNPHSYITVEAKDDQGQVETWLFEGPAPNVFRNLNVGKTDFENAVNKTVKVEASRARDGSLKGLMRIMTFPDGRSVSLCPQNC